MPLQLLQQPPSPHEVPLHQPHLTPTLIRMRPSASRPLLLLALTLPLLAQGAGSFEFHHFHRYPTAGQWRTETTVTGIPVSQPVTPMVQTACASPISLARRDAILKMDNDVAPASCKGTVLRDEERTAEAEQVCTGAPIQTIRTTLHAVDDTTLTTEVRSSTPGRPDTVIHSTSHFLGACNAGQQAEAAANAPLPSLAPGPEACAELPSMRQQAQDGLKVCESADFPQDERVTCRSTMSAVLQRVQKLQTSCGK